MSDVAIESRWVGGQRFEAGGQGPITVPVDGETGAGPSPMETLLISFSACMGADVVDILEKMRVPFEGMTVRVEGDRRSDPPRRYTTIRLTYRVTGVPEESRDKLQRAVDLSRDKYCSVLHSLRPDIGIAIRIEAG